MKDIDFDELDKAVSSLMGSIEPDAQRETPQTLVTPPTQPVPSPTAVVSTEQPARTTQVVESAPVPVTQPVPVRSAPAARRGGRFMDMVSTPVGDTKSRASVQVPTQSREGLSITPRADAEPTVETPAPATPTVIDEPAKTSFDSMPDPIDMNREPEASVPNDEQSASSLGSLDSPFLTDAKVEKRPLNAGNIEPTPDMSVGDEFNSPESVPEAANEPTVERVGADEPPATPQVPELSSDLVAIESGVNVEGTTLADDSKVVSHDDVPASPLGATSIAQQYKTKESSGDQSHAGIYDASQYPEPISHPAKSKSGWLWVLWVVLLLGIGAGGAVVLYNLGIIP